MALWAMVSQMSAPERAPQAVRAIVCDDDPITRSLLSDLVEERGGQVLAEADRGFDAIDIIERFDPDLVLLDLSLRDGSGLEVVHHIRTAERACQVVIFTAFWDAARDLAGPALRVVEKPDFDDLERAIDLAISELGIATATRERRRRASRALLAPLRDESGLDEPADFYRSLGMAEPGDALIGIALGDSDLDALARAARRVVRQHDRITVRSGTLVLLVIGGGADGAASVVARLGRSHPDEASRALSCVMVDDLAPSTALDIVSGRAPRG
jgi:CheY-like chemotaxis protein